MNKDEMRRFVDKFKELPGKSGGLPLCGICGDAHLGDCPPIKCRMCGTTHKRNPVGFDRYDYCEKNAKLTKYIKGHNEWVKKNTAGIWNQPNKESNEG